MGASAMIQNIFSSKRHIYQIFPLSLHKEKERKESFIMEQAKRVPYGVSNFVDIIERNQYYVDKTMYLPLLEKRQTLSSLYVLEDSARVC